MAPTGAGAAAGAGAAGGGGIGKVNMDPNGLFGGKANFAGSQMNVGEGLTNTPGSSGNGEGNTPAGNQMINMETPGDSMGRAAKPFEQYVTDARAKAQVLMSDPGLKQIVQPQAVQQPQQAPVQEKKKEEEKQQMDFNDFVKMIDYVNAAKKQNELKKQGDTTPTTTTK